MSDYMFEDDKPYVKFKCLELATEVEKYKSATKVVDTARMFEEFVLPRAPVINIATPDKRAKQK